MGVTIEQSIKDKIEAAFSPCRFELVNESGKHKGHAGDNGTGQTHFKIEIEAEALKGKSRVEAQRMIYSTLDEEFSNGLHALSIKIVQG